MANIHFFGFHYEYVRDTSITQMVYIAGGIGDLISIESFYKYTQFREDIDVDPYFLPASL